MLEENYTPIRVGFHKKTCKKGTKIGKKANRTLLPRFASWGEMSSRDLCMSSTQNPVKIVPQK